MRIKISNFKFENGVFGRVCDDTSGNCDLRICGDTGGSQYRV